MNVDLSKTKKIHFVGIKGVAMTALAIYATQAGLTVTGSDTSEEFPTQPELEKLKIQIFGNFDGGHITRVQPDLVIYTGAHGGGDNVEVVRAVKLGIPVMSHGQALGLFMQGKRQISVAGSHGKTTTAAMIAVILRAGQKDPSYAVGCGEIFPLGAAGHFGQGDFFVAEADEYVTDPRHDLTPRFLWQRPDIAVVTNIDFDHPDVYHSLSDVGEAFRKFIGKIPPTGTLVANGQDETSQSLLPTSACRTMTYGLAGKFSYTADNVTFLPGQVSFEVKKAAQNLGRATIRVPGIHNVANALAATAAAMAAGVSWEAVRDGLSQFLGTKRRFEQIGQKNSVVFYDDYAHHPKEILATLNAVRQWYPHHRIITVFQPHTYSRTQALLNDFGWALSKSGVACVTDIYGSSRESEQGKISGQDIANKIISLGGRAVFAKGAVEVTRFLSSALRSNDIVLFMGAGDIFRWEKNVVRAL